MAKNKKTLNQKSKKTDVSTEQNDDNETISLDDKIKELESKLLTSLADNENLRKRFDREKEDLSNYVISEFAKEILSVLDNLQRAMATANLEEVKEKSSEISQLLEGIELTEKQIISTFEKFKIEQVKSMGEQFDPTYTKQCLKFRKMSKNQVQ